MATRSTQWFGADGVKISRGEPLNSDNTPRQLLATSSKEAAELEVFGADHEDDEGLTEEQVEGDDDADDS